MHTDQTFFYIDDVRVTLKKEDSAIRVTATHENVLLTNQDFDSVQKIVTKNHQIVKNHYQPNSAGCISAEELNKLCLSIVLRTLCVYNLWRSLYANEKNRDLTFIHSDFYHPNTYDIILMWGKKRHPKNYTVKCAELMGVKPLDVLSHEEGRKKFFEIR